MSFTILTMALFYSSVPAKPRQCVSESAWAKPQPWSSHERGHLLEQRYMLKNSERKLSNKCSFLSKIMNKWRPQYAAHHMLCAPESPFSNCTTGEMPLIFFCNFPKQAPTPTSVIGQACRGMKLGQSVNIAVKLPTFKSSYSSHERLWIASIQKHLSLRYQLHR